MKNLFFYLLPAFLITTKTFSATGDTTVIVAHTLTNLASPPSNYSAWVNIPSLSVTYQKILMKFTLGCGTPACSHWDYTVNAEVGKKNGTLDSAIASIDTVQHDTTWNYTDHVEYIELGRLITPYGNYMDWQTNGFTNSWTHPFYYDVTDYAEFLKDSVDVRVHYDGWSSAFSARVEFIFIEGTPSRTVESVRQIYHRGVGYANSSDFENQVPAQSFFINSNVTAAKVLIIMTGHGQGGEFDPHSIHLKVNGTEIYTHLLWKDDCDVNAVAPQGGTWIFHRANWCPGDKVPIFECDITPYITPNANLTVDLDFDDFNTNGYSYVYGLSAHLITYTAQHNNDVMLEEIIAPNNDKPYLHWNPISTNPKVKIKNMGQNPLSYAEISYWVKGGQKWYYEWNGYLKTYESETVTLPAFSWNGLDTTDRIFYAEAKWPNQIPDEYPDNDLLASTFNMVPKLDSVFFIFFKTNEHPEENAYVVRNENGDTIDFKNSFPASTVKRDTLHLVPGSYSFDFYDYDAVNWGCGDGLSFFINQQDTGCTNHPECKESAGILRLQKIGLGPYIKVFDPELGANAHYEFTVGYPLGYNAPKTPPAPPVHNGIAALPYIINMNVFPNPASEVLTVVLDFSKTTSGNLQLYDLTGRSVYQTEVSNVVHEIFSVPVKNLTAGIYFLKFYNSGGMKTVKVMVK